MTMESMKKLSIYLLLVFAGLTVTSCVDPISPQPEHNTGKYGINLSVICQSLETKATKHGEDQYNENLLSTVDWFIFTSDADESVLVKHGHEPKDTESGTLDQGTSEQLVTQAIKVNKDPIPMDDYIAASGMSGYIFLVANAPGSITVTDGTTTLEDLRKLDVTANFGALTSGGKFQRQDNFVMTGGKDFTFTAQEPVLTRTVELSRIAAKVSLNVSVVPAIDEIITMPNGKKMYKQTWYPDLSKIQIYLSYADNHAVVAGTPDEFSSPGGSLFTYDRNAFTANYSYTGYSGTDPVNPDAITPTWTNPDWKWNVTGSPFYSYPMKWKTTSPYSPFIKIILPWTAYKEPTTVTTVTTDDGPTEVIKVGRFKGTTPDGEYSGQSSERIGQSNFYYKIPIPSANPKGEGDNKYLQLLQNEWYNLILDVAILGGTSDDLPLELAGQYFVVDWNNPDVQAGGVMKQGRYLSTATDTYYIYGGNDIEIPVSSSHELTTGASLVTKREFLYNSVWIDASANNIPDVYQLTNLKTRALSVGADPATGRSAITFTCRLNSDMNTQMDCYPMRFTLELSHSDGQGPKKKIIIYQYPSIHIASIPQPDGSAFVNGYYGNINGRFRDLDGSTGNSGTSTTSSAANSVNTGYGRIAKYDNDNTNLTVITITAFSNNSKNYTVNVNGTDTQRNYVIADPREPANFSSSDLNPYYLNGQQSWGDDAQKIMKGVTTPEFIAPKLIVASTWGRQRYGSTGFEDTQKRCATYQEAGYPAGRWRLPTEAEVVFIMNLQKYDFLEKDLFNQNDNVWNWISDGNLINMPTGNNPTIRIRNTLTGNATSRCVYDLWFWGDNPGDRYVYNPEP